MADIRSYYQDLRAQEAQLFKHFPDGVVHVTSLFHRDRGSTPGSTLSATWYNAARVITDGTHRLATVEEVKGFHDRQADERAKNQLQEQRNRQQFFVVVDPNQQQAAPAAVPIQSTTTAPASPREATAAERTTK